jgi:hypothetical protein
MTLEGNEKIPGFIYTLNEVYTVLSFFFLCKFDMIIYNFLSSIWFVFVIMDEAEIDILDALEETNFCWKIPKNL